MQGASGLDRLTSAPAPAVVRHADAAVVQRIAGGDRAAMAELYDRYADVVFSLACRIVTVPADAEDVVQEVFTQAWRQAVRYDAARASAAAWLLNITRTRAIDRVRADRTRQRSAERRADRVAPAAGEIRSSRRSAASAPSACARRCRVVGRGAAARRSTWRTSAGSRHGEIAERLDEPLGTIKTRIRSGLLKLREALMERT